MNPDLLQGYVDGEPVSGERTFDVVNPATEAAFARAGAAGARDVERAIAAARRAFDAGVWSAASRTHRAEAVRRLLAALEARRGELLPLMVDETGCPVGSAVMAVQFDAPVRHTRDFVELYLSLPDEEDGGLPPAERFTPGGGLIQSIRRHVPLGVVTAISACNFPLQIGLWKVIPALLAGNSVILRPSPLTPHGSVALAAAAHEAGLPPGVFNLVLEPGDAGAVALTSDPRIDMVTFTGSTRVGQMVMRQGAETMKRLQLELGGKSAQIFLPDAADRAVENVAASCTAHAGQVCMLGSRVFVPQARKADLLDAMRARLATIRIGDPRDPETQMGPLVNAAARGRCEALVAAAVAAGGRLCTGGARPGHLPRGFFFEPTILDLPDTANPLAQTEVFGPVIAVIGYRDIDDAVRMANDTRMGLSATVFGADLGQAAAVARGIEAGTVNVNGGLISAHVSSGGWKLSGLGRERGPEGLRIFQNMQVLNVVS